MTGLSTGLSVFCALFPILLRGHIRAALPARPQALAPGKRLHRLPVRAPCMMFSFCHAEKPAALTSTSTPPWCFRTTSLRSTEVDVYDFIQRAQTWKKSACTC